jgi:hypothetical protein
MLGEPRNRLSLSGAAARKGKLFSIRCAGEMSARGISKMKILWDRGIASPAKAAL